MSLSFYPKSCSFACSVSRFVSQFASHWLNNAAIFVLLSTRWIFLFQDFFSSVNSLCLILLGGDILNWMETSTVPKVFSEVSSWPLDFTVGTLGGELGTNWLGKAKFSGGCCNPSLQHNFSWSFWILAFSVQVDDNMSGRWWNSWEAGWKSPHPSCRPPSSSSPPPPPPPPPIPTIDPTLPCLGWGTTVALLEEFCQFLVFFHSW